MSREITDEMLTKIYWEAASFIRSDLLFTIEATEAVLSLSSLLDIIGIYSERLYPRCQQLRAELFVAFEESDDDVTI